MELRFHGKENKAQGDSHQHGGEQNLPQALYEEPRMLLVGGIMGGLEIHLLIGMVDLGVRLTPEKKKPRCPVWFKDMKGSIRAISPIVWDSTDCPPSS